MRDCRRRAFALAGLVLLLDQATKLWAVSAIEPWHGRIPVVPGLFDLVHYYNKGAAFGLLNQSGEDGGGAFVWLFTAIAVAAVLGLAWLLQAASPPVGLREVDGPGFRLGLGAVLGGTIGNLTDRLRLGAVVDFLDVYVGRWHWPAFNVADMAITLGCLGLAWRLLVPRSSPPDELKE